MKQKIIISGLLLSALNFSGQTNVSGSNISNNSTIEDGNNVLGQNNTINQSGTINSFLFGSSNTINANNTSSFAMGASNTINTGTQSFAMGASNTVSGAQNFALGNSMNISGNQNMATGYGNYIYSGTGTGKITSGTFASGINNYIAYNSSGSGTNHETSCSSVFGAFNAVGGQYNYAFGLRALAGVSSYTATTTSTLSNAYAFGMNVTAGASGAMVIGSGRYLTNNTTHTNDVVNNTPNSLVITFSKQTVTNYQPLASRPTLFVGEADQNLSDANYAKYGTVGIGTNDTKGHTLGVRGDIIAEKIQVALYSGGWPDYVFSKGYKLDSLSKIENYIFKNNHLPNLPCAKDIEQNGYDLANMDAKLLEKIEELTLYMIEMNKQLESLKKENELLKLKLK